MTHLLAAALLAVLATGDASNGTDANEPVRAELVVELRARAEAHRNPVRLEDVADVRGPADEALRLRAVDLGPPPPSGSKRIVTPAGVRLAATLAGIDLPRERIAGAPQVEVSASWLDLSVDRLWSEAERFVLSRSQEIGSQLLLERETPPDAIGLLNGGGEASIECDFIGPPRSRAQVRILVKQGASYVGERVCTFKIRRFGRQARLLTGVKRGDAVRPDQILTIDGEWTALDGTPVTTAQELAGLVAKRDLDAGSVLMLESLEPPVLVNRGDSLRIVLKTGAIEIVARAIAQRAGRRGETIPVTQPGTQKVLQVELAEDRPGGGVVGLVR